MKLHFLVLPVLAMVISMTQLSCLRGYDELEKEDLILDSDKPINNAPVGRSVILSSGVEVEEIDGKYILGGDMVLTEEQLNKLDSDGILTSAHVPSPSVIGGKPIEVRTGLWYYPDSVVSRANAKNPYTNNMWSMVRFVYAPDLPENIKSAVRTAIRFWQGRTNVRFYNATGEPTGDPSSGLNYPYVYFCKGERTQSYVGQIGGKQDLTISEYDCAYQTIAHEIGHAVGMYHEHMRHDRDEYIIVNMDNIVESARKNFQKITTDYYTNDVLDFESMMMYPSYTGYEIVFRIPSMTKLDGSTFEVQRTYLSVNDCRYANKFFLPFVARSDSYYELESVVYDANNRRLSESERLSLQSSLNDGIAVPPPGGRIPNNI